MRSAPVPFAAVLLLAAGGLAAVLVAAELQPATLQAYRHFIANADRQFMKRVSSPTFLWVDEQPARLRRVRAGEVIVAAGTGDGIVDIPKGKIHDWRGAVFIKGARLEDVLAVSQNYAGYANVYGLVLQSKLLGVRGSVYEAFLRMKKGTRYATAVLDTWWSVTYTRPRGDRAFAKADIDRVQQVQDAGGPDERRLPADDGSGYLWRADGYSQMLERDGGVYLELENVGLSRDFPIPPFGWIVASIARRLGRSSISDTLVETRTAALAALEKTGRH